MLATDCRHKTATEIGRVCAHLLSAPEGDYCKRFTGRGRKYDLLCTACRAAPGAADLRVVCLQCLREIEEAGWWDGVLGQPQVAERRTDLAFVHDFIRLAALDAIEILDIQPVDASPQPLWIALTATGRLLRIDLAGDAVTAVADLSASHLDLTSDVSLRLDRPGHFAAVVNTHGQHGLVVDLRSGMPTIALERDAYHIKHSVFPAVFFEFHGQTLLAHGTAWNRLDISDPATGRLLTDRTPTTYQRGEARPEHYLDYFHCTLAVSPDQEWLADNGWVWSPFGVVAAWSLRRWAEENVWESEDGPSMRRFCQRGYYWDGPWCWVGNRTLAVWGYGLDDEWLIPAAWLFDVESGAEVRWFAGPSGQFYFDTYLFSCSAQDGTTVWDVATGERLCLDLALRPTRYHRGARQFLTLLPDGAFQLSRLREPGGKHLPRGLRSH